MLNGNLTSPEPKRVTLALAYRDLNWEPIRLPFREKSPSHPWKNPVFWSEQEIKEAFDQRCNVGVALGARSNDLVDLDFDCPEAAHFAQFLFGHLPSFGRASSLSSHRIVTCQTSRNREAFSLDKSLSDDVDADRLMLLELRSSGHQTMFPPSIHPSGEEVRWEGSFDRVPCMEESELRERCGLLAAVSAFAMFYPRQSGERDEVCMMLSSVLLQSGCPEPTINVLVTEIARYAGDEEAYKRGGKVQSTLQRIEKGETVWGLPELCKRLGLEAQETKLRQWLGLKTTGFVDDGRPTIVVQPGKRHIEVDRAEKALLESSFSMYQRGNQLVRVVVLPRSSVQLGVSRSGGVSIVYGVKKAWLQDKFGTVANWGKRGKKGNPVPIDPPTAHAEALLGREGEWNAPVLNGLVAAPTLRPDMTLIQEPGYDEPTGLLYDPGGVDFPLIPELPSREDALAAKQVLLRPFREFAFASDADRSVVIAAILTSLVRRILPSAPLFAVDAPTAGSGKSLLVELVGTIATGHKPAMMSQGKSPEEDEKRLSSVLMAGDAILVIDNCDRPLGGDALCTILTQEVYRARVLGKSETPELMTNVLVMATGNNLTIEGDLGRRTLICRIDTGAERPDEISHSFNAHEEVLRERPKLVAAALTILIAYARSDEKVQLRPMGSFEQWNPVREAIVWLDEEDPAITRHRIIADDPRKNELAELLQTWRTAVGGEAVTIAEIGKRADGAPGNRVTGLRDMLSEMTYGRSFNAKSIGRVLMRHKDRVVGGLVLRAIDDPSKAKRYMVEELGSPPADRTAF